MYEILKSSEFYNKYSDKLKPGEFKFITKAYRQTDNTVALYEDENAVDCYFQLPGFKSLIVPDNRRFIYRIGKGDVLKGGFIKMDDGRYKIPVDKLELWSDPYDKNPINFDEQEEVKTAKESSKKESLLQRVDRLTKEAEERVERLEFAIKRLSEVEERILKTLSELEDGD